MSKLPHTPVVYLAGGMRSRWQDQVTQAAPALLYLDPSLHKNTDEHIYTAWDLTGVERCDIVFGYLERDNPGGEGLAVEFGVACALGKHIILVEEPGHPRTRYFGMVRSVSDVTCTTLEEGMRALLKATGYAAVRGESKLLNRRPYLNLDARPA